jgi:hypothetical protein
MGKQKVKKEIEYYKKIIRPGTRMLRIRKKD